ncbi:putative nvRNAP beta' subunit 2 [Erwinia phage vB_EamM_RAY]|uniref:NvRNAP beta' subunit 2 n=10 Tax=Agricanvirus TaxID=1984776 RepID=A0A173GF33_9CAUD|nr:RNA polymerase beta subunit [Erwinia phage Ea35-70]YP_009605398.1 RNA polymerase beta subunit [Erwinia phage vB_EamM_Deimos-Minion]YP_009605715.1 RNA polymerase beta subunit [Erwinia phage vB_EamM_RAY]YP_009606037.1 RNA polymerase beta subunit [Erwinia phage vB_EamM_Simmy50]YP_009606358.1 RNA polymerase beta subunit [Erwinia phage vB_EamM_Special G]YP_009621991.1 RNA polymerase beta subunit [Erwinia phage vB_EamM_Desertfox]AUG86037.1 putative DNA directed RNA polymerase beta subunit [Erwin
MQSYHWRDLLSMSEEQIWQLDPAINNPIIEVVAEDATFKIPARQVIGSWYCWPFQKLYRNMVLCKRHFITAFRLSNKTILGIMTNGYRDYDAMMNGTILDVVALNSLIAKTANRINNAFVTKIPEYVTTSGMKQYIEIVDDPEFKAIRDAMEPNQNSIRDGYDASLKLLMDPKKYVGNQVAEYVKQGSASAGQALQCLVVRGYLTDHNSRIFVKPVMGNYVEGLGKFYDSFVESRSATKAALFTKKPLEDSEWFNRKMQLVAQAVQKIHLGEDCGSTITVPIVMRRGWASAMAGTYYLDDDGSYKMITEEDKHLENRLLNIRSPMYCNHPDRTGICERCYGKLAVSIPYFNVEGKVGDNQVIVGHVSATEIGEDLSQKMLSTKHLDTSSTVDPFAIRRADALYVKPGLRENAIRLNPRLRNEKVTMKVSFDKTTALSDIAVAENLDEVATRVSGFNEIVLEFEREDGGKESIPINTTQGSRQGQFTVDFLRYLQRVSWTSADKDYISIRLDQFEYDCDVVELPLVHEDMMAYQKQIESYIRFSKESANWKNKFVTPDEVGVVLDEFFSLLRQRLGVNIVHAQIMLYSVMTMDPAKGDYRLPRAYEPRQFSSYHECIEYRSLSVQLVYQEQAAVMLKPSTFLNDKRQPHPMDEIFK